MDTLHMKSDLVSHRYIYIYIYRIPLWFNTINQYRHWPFVHNNLQKVHLSLHHTVIIAAGQTFVYTCTDKI
jgi:hypothetical protein